MTAGRSSRRLVAVLVAALAVLSGCATIPGHGPVLSGGRVDEDPQKGVVQLEGENPRSGASATQVVSGFLGNAAGFSDDHSRARSFLTPARRLAWRPDFSVTVYPTKEQLIVKEVAAKPVAIPASTATPSASPSVSPPVSPEPGPDSGGSADVRDRAEATRIDVTMPEIAGIDVDGRYQPAAPGKTKRVSFNLVKMGGEWKISSLPDGILIDSTDFGVTFRPFPVYFADPTRRYLVPDLHWFPGTPTSPTTPELPTALVRVLLQGPPKWLSGAVITAFPAGTKMAVAAVVVTDDVATVDLTAQVQNARTPDRQLLAAQLQATLGQLRTIGSVKITAARKAFEIPADAGGSSTTEDPSRGGGPPVVDPQVDSRPVVIDPKGRLARLDGGTLVPVKDVEGLAVAGANRPAVSGDSSAYAVLNADRSKLLLQLPGAKVATVVSSAALTAPSFDPSGRVWTAPGANTGSVYASGPESTAIRVSAPWLKGRQVVSMRLSRDGTRVAVVARYRGTAQLLISGVRLDGGGRPASLTPAIRLVPDLTTVVDVAWVDERQVVVLGSRSTQTGDGPWLAQVGGAVHPSVAVPQADSITAGNGPLALMAGTRTGVLVRSGALWDKLSTARWPAFPG